MSTVEAGYLLAIGNWYLEKYGSQCPLPDPLLKDQRCQDRTLYFCLFLEKLRAGKTLTEAEIQALGAGLLLTKNVQLAYDGFSFASEEKLIDKGGKFSLPPPFEGKRFSQKQAISIVSFARKYLAEQCTEQIKSFGALPEAAYADPATKNPFYLKDCGALPILPFYSDYWSIFEIAHRKKISIAVQSVLLEYDKINDRYTYANDDLLFFYPGPKPGQFVLKPQADCDRAAPAIVFKGFQIRSQSEKENFQDDIESLRSGRAALQEVLLPLIAIHPQVYSKEDCATAYSSGIFFSSDAPMSDFAKRFACDRDAAVKKGMSGVKYLNWDADTQTYTRPNCNVPFQIEHVFPARISEICELNHYIHKRCGLQLPKTVEVDSNFDLPDTHRALQLKLN